jgi:hypothetical protein
VCVCVCVCVCKGVCGCVCVCKGVCVCGADDDEAAALGPVPLVPPASSGSSSAWSKPSSTYGDEKVANLTVRLGFGTARQKTALERWTNAKTPPTHLGSCRYLTLCRGVLDLSIIQ